MQSIEKLSRTLVVSLLVSALATASSFASSTDDGVRAAVASGRSARVIMHFATSAERDAEFSRASQVSLDAGVRVLAIQATPARDTSIHKKATAGQPADAVSPGRGGMSVAIIDSGIAPHADLPLRRIRAYKDFVTGGRTPIDNCGHGTHVAGIIAGSGARSNGAYTGIAPDVDIVALRAVAGAALLLLRDNHKLTANTLKVALQFTARLLPLTDVLTQGAGALNISGALTFASAINPDVPHGKSWIRHRVTASNRDASGNVVAWGRRIIYGDRFVRSKYAELHLFRWDDDIVWAYDAIADNIVWGNSDDDNIVWGHSHLREVWASNVVWGFWADNLSWGNITRQTGDNIVWGHDDDPSMSLGAGNIVWGHSVVIGGRQ